MTAKPRELGICKLCGNNRLLSFEHIPPQASGNNSRVKLFSGVDTISNDRKPWDLQGLKYTNSQRGSGGYYLCEPCNNDTGAWYAYALTDLFKQTRAQHVVPFSPRGLKALSWNINLLSIRPFNIAKQVLLMIACVNQDSFMADHKLRKLIQNRRAKPKAFPHSLQVYLNAGSISASYPQTVLFSFGSGARHVTGVSTDLYNFQLELNTKVNPIGYLDITNWLLDYSYEQDASLMINVPVFENHIVFPENHKTRDELLATKAEDSRLHTN